MKEIVSTFQHNKSDIQVVLERKEDHFVIYCQTATGHCVNGFRYYVNIDTQIDAKTFSEFDPVKQLIQYARSNVESNQWEELQAIEAELSNG